MYYILEKDNNSKLLETSLQKEAMNKIKTYQDYLKTLKYKKLDSDNSNDTEDDYTSDEEEGLELSDSGVESSSIDKSNTKSISKKVSKKKT